MKRFVGIDGGGTKTDFLLIDDTGRSLATRREGSAYYLETGMDGLRRLLSSGIEQLLASTGLASGDITYAYLGIPAYGENESLLPTLDRIADDALPSARYACANDVNCGWAGALAGCDGIAVVAGTGSIAYGQFEGRSARAGGWGELFGDEGSAYWVAREALNLFSRMSDGRLRRGLLYQRIREHFATERDLEICAAVYGPPALGRRELAALSRLVADTAGEGDKDARNIFSNAASELASLVHAIRDNLEVPDGVDLPVSWCGGMLHSGGLLLPLFETALHATFRRYELRRPRLLPCAGAALYAATLAGSPLSEAAIRQLESTHAASGARIDT
jgi:N-acetylglucosamine kinase-like BadF-type ATPase